MADRSVVCECWHPPDTHAAGRCTGLHAVSVKPLLLYEDCKCQGWQRMSDEYRYGRRAEGLREER